MADDGAPRAARRHPARVALIVTAGCAMVALCGAAAQGMLALQHAYAGTTGGRLAHLVAAGSTWGTAWPGWVATGFFVAATLRVRGSAPEPPAGRAPLESMSLPQLHRGLLREYIAVRCALVVLSVVALLDAARAARYVVAAMGGDVLAGSTLPPLLVESAGLLVAAGVLVLWAASFRTQLRRLGATP